MTATIISYCTNDYRFIKKCVDEALVFSDEVIVSVCDHFFDGSPENRQLLHQTYSENPRCRFIEFSYDSKRLYSHHKMEVNDPSRRAIWHSTGRYVGFLHLSPHIERVLFLDADEIVEGAVFAKWLKTKECEQWKAVRLFAYFYFLKPTLRANVPQVCSFFAKVDSLKGLYFYQVHERYALFQLIEGAKAVVGLVENSPFIHHYSWVRLEKENLKKAKTWGHFQDGDWEKEIRSSFRGDELKKFFRLDFEKEEVLTPYFDPFAVEIPKKMGPFPPFSHVKTVTRKDILAIEIERQG